MADGVLSPPAERRRPSVQEQMHEGETEKNQPQAPQKSGRTVPRSTNHYPE
jgi:hypothetical protein